MDVLGARMTVMRSNPKDLLKLLAISAREPVKPDEREEVGGGGAHVLGESYFLQASNQRFINSCTFGRDLIDSRACLKLGYSKFKVFAVSVGK